MSTVLVRDGEGADRAVAQRARRAHDRMAGVPRKSGCEGAGLSAGRPGGQGPDRTGARLPRTLVPARLHLRLTGRFHTQLADWLAVVNTRTRRALGCAPSDRITADRQAMLALPPVAPATGWRASTRLPRDHYIRLNSNDYSVHPGVIGRRVEIIADLARVRAVCDGKLVADHERIWAWHQTISDPEHVAAATPLRPPPGRAAPPGPPARSRAGGRTAVPNRLRHRTGRHQRR
jgi:Mu transposase-like protein